MPKKIFLNYLLEQIKASLEEEMANQEKLMSDIKKSLSDVDGISVTTSNKSDMAIVVRVDDKDQIEKARKKVRSAIKSGGISLEDKLVKKFDPSIECTVAEYSDGSGRVYVVYKYDIGSREGLALEHVVQFLLTRKITDELKNRLDLSPEADKEEVKAKLKGDYRDTLDVALKGKKLIDGKIGQVVNAESVGSTNNKADLILSLADGRKVGLSIKLVTEEGRGVRFTYNKNLGYGDEKDDNLVRNPSGKPWWLVGRQIFASKVGSRKYSAGAEDYEAPAWMVTAKEKHSDIYKEAMSELYAKVRDVLTTNLRRMKLKELVAMVNEAHMGVEEERSEYDEFYVLTSTSEGVKLESKDGGKPDLETIKAKGMNKADIVRQEDSRIIIDIPGLEPLTIHSVKFHSDMLSGDKQSLKIKTR
jgi:hypothetical protein